MIFYILIFTFLSFYLFIIVKRAKKYKYNQTNNYIYNLEKKFIKDIFLKGNSFTLEKELENFDTLFLKLYLSKNIYSYFFKPYIEIEGIKHYFEFGAAGTRYLNISHLQNHDVKVNLNHLKLKAGVLKLYGYKNNIDLSQNNILILAPHADDAEIAAFGLYKTASNVTIVTTTAGEHGLCNYCDLYPNDKTKSSLKKAQLRAIDALTVPLFGNIAIENSLALGYFGGTIQWMRENPDKEAVSFVTGINDMNQNRKVSHSVVGLNRRVKATYKEFLNDLDSIIKYTKPDIIITPHPIIDSHPDHKYTTLALLEVLQNSTIKSKLLLYTNHLTLSESYPTGFIHSSISLPPNQNLFPFDSLFSFSLDKDLQIDKFFALESIHDLRDSFLQTSIKKVLKHLKKLIKRVIFSKDKSYFRRAIRANELFFVVEDIESFSKKMI